MFSSSTALDCHASRLLSVGRCAAGEGLEPSQADPRSAVLPLDEPAVERRRPPRLPDVESSAVAASPSLDSNQDRAALQAAALPLELDRVSSTSEEAKSRTCRRETSRPPYRRTCSRPRALVPCCPSSSSRIAESNCVVRLTGAALRLASGLEGNTATPFRATFALPRRGTRTRT